MKAKITSILETSDHDGYCSENECEYYESKITKIVDVPSIYSSYPLGFLKNINEYNWKSFFVSDIEPYKHTKSFFCGLSDECKKNELGRHDAKYSIISVELIDL